MGRDRRDISTVAAPTAISSAEKPCRRPSELQQAVSRTIGAACLRLAQIVIVLLAYRLPEQALPCSSNPSLLGRFITLPLLV